MDQRSARVDRDSKASKPNLGVGWLTLTPLVSHFPSPIRNSSIDIKNYYSGDPSWEPSRSYCLYKFFSFDILDKYLIFMG